MKTRLTTAVFMALVLVSCARENDIKNTNPERVSITATLSESLSTKVTFTPGEEGGKPKLSLAWADGDVIRVYDHADHTKYSDFALDASAVGQKVGKFSGTPIAASSYDIEVYNASLNYSDQTQPGDGLAGDLKYIASVTNVSSYSTVNFTDVSSVLYVKAKLPSTTIAAGIKSMEIVSSESIFFDNGTNDGKTITVTLTSTGDTGSDSILGFYAYLPVGSTVIPDGTELFVRFYAPGTAHTVYTRYINLPLQTLMSGKLNTITVNASHSDQWAGVSDNGSATAPYLIADKYQMQAMHDLVVAGEKKYFKLLTDIDLENGAWTPVNTGGTEYVNIDGTNHTLSNFTVTGTTSPTGLFSKFNGQVYDLTIDGATVTSTSGALGVLAGNLGDGGSETVKVENVTISNCHVGDDAANLHVSGILAGNVNKTGTIIKGVTVSGSDITGPKSGVSNNMYMGGLLGYVRVEATIQDCRVSGCTVTGRDIVGGLIGGLGNNNNASCTYCFVEDTVIDAGFRRVGGLVGMINGATISCCGVEGDVTVTSSSYDVAGLVGMASNAFTVENSYSKASVTGSNQVGGLLGRLYGPGTVSTCYNSGLLTSSQTVIGGLVGSVEAAGTVAKCISWNESLSLYGQQTSGGSGADIQSNNYTKTASESGTVSSHAQEAARAWSDAVWDFGKAFPTLIGSGSGSSAPVGNTYNIIPYPASLTTGDGSFAVLGAGVYFDSAFSGAGADVVNQFAARLNVTPGSTSGSGEASGFNFMKNDSLGEEAYNMTVTGSKVVVEASTRTGLFYAVQTLKQLMPTAVYGTSAVTAEWTIPVVEIEDAPRFGYRGFILDVCRHFYTVDEVKKYIDLMAMHKMNRFHWVLTNDQGWRFPVPSYPNLITVGAYRVSSPAYPGTSRDNGFYTREQLEEIVQYAADRCITVVPEFDIPGHTIAALASYPELGCVGSGYSVMTGAGTSPDVLCIGKGETNNFAFVKAVLDEIMDIFPSEYIHIGGDEVPSTVKWKSCGDCLALISSLGIDTEYTNTQMQDMGYSKIAVTKATRLQYYFMKQIRSYLASNGRKMIGWQEVINDEYDLDNDDSWQFPKGMIESWTSTARGIFAANKGIDVVMAPSWGCYFDIMQTATQGEPGDGPVNGGSTSNGNKTSLSPSEWRPVTLSAAYTWNPVTSVSAGNQSHVKGVECAMWTEYISTISQLEYMLLPRLAATSEVAWSEQEDKNFTRFTTALTDKFFDIYDTLGYNYRHTFE